MNEPPSMWFSSIFPFVLDNAGCLLARTNNNRRQELKLISVVTTRTILSAFRPVRLADLSHCTVVRWSGDLSSHWLTSPLHQRDDNQSNLSLSSTLYVWCEKHLFWHNRHLRYSINTSNGLPLIFHGMKGWDFLSLRPPPCLVILPVRPIQRLRVMLFLLPLAPQLSSRPQILKLHS